MNKPIPLLELPSKKFSDPNITAKGEQRASVAPVDLETLWINTGSLCNLSCEHCYIESTPTNDRLVYISSDEVRRLLEEIETENFNTREIGFTGGEPFLNPDMVEIIEACLEKGFEVLVLTNAMNTMLRAADALIVLNENYPGKLTLRVSLDHYLESRHAEERGKRSWKPAIKGLKWLSDNDFAFCVAGRTFWGEDESAMRAGYAELFANEAINLDAQDTDDLVLFPEMDTEADVPEITTACWGILDKSPDTVMCASSRMVVKHKGDEHLSVQACTLLPYDQRFNMGRTLRESWQPIKLNHPHCAKFCVLGSGSCS